MKKTLSIILSLLMLLGSVSIGIPSALADDNENIYTMISGRMVIKPGVTNIPTNFINKDDINNVVSVDMPSTVTEISQKAFYNCANLSSINLSNNITEIQPYTFYGWSCTRLI